MAAEREIIVVVVVVVLLGVAGGFFLELHKKHETESLFEQAYRQGQIDAANGKMLYELKQLPDGSTAWERKDGGE
jgi:flagellar basal body-associated protein FliL